MAIVSGYTVYACILEADSMKHYRAKPSAQLPKDMHILHCCYKLVDNHLEIVPVCELEVVKAMGITLFLNL